MSNVSIRNLDLSVMDIMDRWPETLSVFLRHKMLCIGCSVAPFHTVEDACVEHDLDVEIVRNELDAVIAKSGLHTA